MFCYLSFLGIILLSLSCCVKVGGINKLTIKGTGGHNKDYADYSDYGFLSQEVGQDNFHDRVIGGKIVTPNSIPYQAGISIKKDSKNSWCGGSVISNEYIVTAAHCLYGAKSATLILGAHDRSIKVEKGRINIEIPKDNFILHDQYDQKALLNDIALIKLSSPINFTAEIQPIALPWNFNSTFEGENVTFSGWGRYDWQEKHSRYLRQGQSVIALNSECANYYKKFKPKTNICLDGSKGQGTCKGDSGGPLIVRDNNNNGVIIGINSFGTSQGCDKRKHNAFTRLTAFLSWIKEKAEFKID